MIRRLVTAVAVALLGLAGAGAATAAPAPTALTAPAAPADAAGAATLSLTGYGPAVLIPGSSLAVAATVSNPTALGKAGLNVALKVTDSPITTSAALESFLANPGIFTTRTAATAIVNSSAVGSAPNVLPPGGMGKVELAATPTTLGFPADSAGVYGVVIAITDAMGTVTEQTAAVTWYDAPITNLPLALVATASGSEERVQQVVAAASDADATLAIDPVSGTVQGRRMWGAISLDRENLLPFLYKLHYTMHLPEGGGIEWGIWLMGLVGIVWVFDTLIALSISFPNPRQWARSLAFRWRAGGHRLAFLHQHRDDVVHLHALAAIWHQDLAEDPFVHGFHFHRRLVGLDLGDDVAGLDALAFLLQPARQVALRHGGGKRRHQDVGRHVLIPPAYL